MGFTLDATSPEELAKRKTELAMSEAKTRNLSGMPWRHMIATHLLAGLVSGHTAAGYGRSADRSLTKRAVELTDILIEELAK